MKELSSISAAFIKIFLSLMLSRTHRYYDHVHAQNWTYSAHIDSELHAEKCAFLDYLPIQ